jgi:hypothetical protein
VAKAAGSSLYGMQPLPKEIASKYLLGWLLGVPVIVLVIIYFIFD